MPEDAGRKRAVRLHPGPRVEIPAVRIYENLELPVEHANDRLRPYVIANAVSTLDGKVSREGASSGIGSDVDRYMMRVIRSRVDAVLVGAGTLRAEKLSLTIPDDLASWRESRGESRQPLGIILSRTGDVRVDNLAGQTSKPLVLTERDMRVGEHLRLLRREYGIRRLLVEGGPTVNHALFDEGIVDELFVTLSPKLYGGEDPTLLNGPRLRNPAPKLALLSAHLCENELFLRYSCGQQT